jgi:hypothetical protein
MTELLKRKIIISAACLFTFVGTVAAIEPMCMGWFYTMKKKDGKR